MRKERHLRVTRYIRQKAIVFIINHYPLNITTIFLFLMGDIIFIIFEISRVRLTNIPIIFNRFLLSRLLNSFFSNSSNPKA